MTCLHREMSYSSPMEQSNFRISNCISMRHNPPHRKQHQKSQLQCLLTKISCSAAWIKLLATILIT
ncbi:hypothetical protein BRADI_5g09984v3 [Brachypodium distachyon]|uniref:Uncharacterized protein n=1 Tax=Brachypodium distachyon TaxID=15368 RepID=A0A2K2CGB2_BRADI|nr:hypothetical protein BRADI_5g09984v3 [Brachypodium distachyon]